MRWALEVGRVLRRGSKKGLKLLRRHLEGRNTPFQENDPLRVRPISPEPGKKKAHKLLTHKLFERAVSPWTTSRLTRRNSRKFLFSWVLRRTHKLSLSV